MSLAVLTDAERRTLDASVGLLRERLGDELLSVRVFGSVAPGEAWWDGMPIPSDLDPLYLESWRQLAPQFRTPEEHTDSPSRESIDRDAIEVRYV